LSQSTRWTDRQTDSFLIARPRLHCMQRGKNTCWQSGFCRIQRNYWECPISHLKVLTENLLGWEPSDQFIPELLYVPFTSENRARVVFRKLPVEPFVTSQFAFRSWNVIFIDFNPQSCNASKHLS